MQSLELKNDFLQISEDDYCTAIASYNMTNEMVRARMETIRQWYRMQPHLPAEAPSDDRIFRHLLAVGFDLEKAKTKIDNVLTSYGLVPEMMRERDPCAEWAQRAMECVRVVVLPLVRREDVSRIIMVDFTDKDSAQFDMTDAFKMFFMMCDYCLCADITLGEHYVIDLGTAKLEHVVKITPTMLKKALFLIQGCFGETVKGIHYVNVPTYAEYIITLTKTQLSGSLADIIYVHKGYESLHEFFSRSILPNEKGGELKSMDELADATLAELCQPKWRQWFIEQDKLKTDESKRLVAKSDMSAERLGMHESFRNLDID